MGVLICLCFHLIHFVGQCVDEVSSYRCECEVGFNGTLCEHNINDCVFHTCNNYSLCQDGVNNYTCVCKPGKSVLFLLQSLKILESLMLRLLCGKHTELPVCRISTVNKINNEMNNSGMKSTSKS